MEKNFARNGTTTFPQTLFKKNQNEKEKKKTFKKKGTEETERAISPPKVLSLEWEPADGLD